MNTCCYPPPPFHHERGGGGGGGGQRTKRKERNHLSCACALVCGRSHYSNVHYRSEKQQHSFRFCIMIIFVALDQTTIHTFVAIDQTAIDLCIIIHVTLDLGIFLMFVCVCVCGRFEPGLLFYLPVVYDVLFASRLLACVRVK